jgi:hypothetical protein
MRLDRVVAFAGVLPYHNFVDMKVAAAVRDHPELLERAGDRAYAGPLHAHHLRQKFLGERQIIASEALHAKQPLAHALVNIVNRVTGNRLLHLRREKLLVLNKKLSQGMICRANSHRRADSMIEAMPGHLDHDMVEGQLAPGLLRTRHRGHGGFDRLATDQFHHARNDAAVRKIDLEYRSMRLSEDFALLVAALSCTGSFAPAKADLVC